MSDPEYHLVATGTHVADAAPLVDRLRSLSDQDVEFTVDIWLQTDSHAIPRYRFPPDVSLNHELHIPAEHVAAFVEVLDPLITDENRRSPELGVPDSEGGRWLSVHGAELETLPALPPVPVQIEVWELPAAAFDPATIPTEADHPVCASIEWSAFWPAVPDKGLRPHGKHAAVCLVVNGTNPWDLAPAAPGYRLYLVTEWAGDRRAAHLAAAAGLRLE
jgi:hypothetical protein